MATDAGVAGTTASVPTCPGWSVLDLVAHQGMVHRWATAVVRGEDPGSVDVAGLEAQGRGHADPPEWLREGAAELVRAIAGAGEDLEVMTFLREAPPPRVFWARRQCHETTVHALDARAAVRGGPVGAGEVDLDDALLVDGIDELVVGFWQRRSKGPRSERPHVAAVVVEGGPAWTLEVGAEHPVTRRVGEGHGIPEEARVVRGSAADLYLALWNRGGEVDDPTGLLEEWRGPGAISW